MDRPIRQREIADGVATVALGRPASADALSRLTPLPRRCVQAAEKSQPLVIRRSIKCHMIEHLTLWSVDRPRRRRNESGDDAARARDCLPEWVPEQAERRNGASSPTELDVDEDSDRKRLRMHASVGCEP